VYRVGFIYNIIQGYTVNADRRTEDGFGEYLRVETVFQKAADEWAEGIQGQRFLVQDGTQ